MSALLESLIDPQRRADMLVSDAAMSGIAPDLPIPAMREYVIAVRRVDGTFAEITQVFANFWDAMDFGMDLRTDAHDRVAVRPLIQLTEGEGRAQYPVPPHCDASPAAWRGYHQEAQRDHAAVSFQNHYLRAIGRLNV